MTSTSQIAELWNWFTSVANDFGSHFENTSLLDELDHRVTALGPFTWEIGPADDSDDNVLVLSPGGQVELLAETKQIIALAPACPGWQFLAAKPRKRWDRKFFMGDAPVDASRWQYVLYRYPDGIYDIVIVAPDLMQFDEQDRLMAAEIVLDGELGEEARITLIHDIEVVATSADLDGAAPTPIVSIRHHVETFAPK